MTATIVAVVAAYRPPKDLPDTVAGLVSQFAKVIVVDDGSPSGSETILEAVAATGATVLRAGTNRGIAGALNRGITFAQQRWDPDFFTTFDQDSVPVADYAERAVANYAKARADDVPVGLVVAASYSGRPCHTRFSRHGYAVALDPIQSGFVIPRETLASIGMLDEGLVIDGVDSDYTARARAVGLDAVIGVGCDIEHALGRRDPAVLFGRSVKVFGRQVSYNYHSPQRVYYIVRNGTILTKRYLAKDPAWVGLRLLEEAKAHLLRLAFSPDRSTLARAMAAGLRDGVAGRLGPIPAVLAARLG